MQNSQVFLSGISTSDMLEMFRSIVKEEVARANEQHVDRLLSPSETCKVFQPPISKVTLSSWTKQGLLTDHRIGGRVYYKHSELLEKLTTLRKYKPTL